MREQIRRVASEGIPAREMLALEPLLALPPLAEVQAMPLLKALVVIVRLDLRRPWLVWKAAFTQERLGEMDTELFEEFFRALAFNALVTLHVDNLKGDNAHHQAETVFKAFGRALRMATTPDARSAGVIPSTKGSL